MARHPVFHLVIIFAQLLLTACEPVQQKGPEALDIVLLGTYGYTTFQELGRTIEDYDGSLLYDEARLPDTQVGFPLVLPIAFYNQGKQSWYDSRADVTVSITAPNGTMNQFTLRFIDAEVKRRRVDAASYYLVMDTALPVERRLFPEEHRVFFFETPYTPLQPGVYSLLVELHSKSLTGLRIARSGFAIHIFEAEGGVVNTIG